MWSDGAVAVAPAPAVPTPAVPSVRADIVAGIMNRVGVVLPPDRFVFEVALAYGLEAPTRGVPRTDLSHSDPVFRACIEHSGAAGRVLALGCGDGLCGPDPAHTTREYRAVWSAGDVQQCAVSPPMLWDPQSWPSPPFDTVLSYLMGQYIYDLDRFFALVRAAVKPGGTFVMAGHNNRFWRNPELRGHADRIVHFVRWRGQLRRYLAPDRWRARIHRLFAAQPAAPDLIARINQTLARRVPTRQPVTMSEVVHLIDIHRPSPEGDRLHIGLHGFDAVQLTRDYLPGFALERHRTRGWSGLVDEDRLSAALRARSAHLAERYPEDGTIFAACWRRTSEDASEAARQRPLR